MSAQVMGPRPPRGLSVFERYLTAWVLLCIGAGILLGKVAPEVGRRLDSLAIYVGGARSCPSPSPSPCSS